MISHLDGYYLSAERMTHPSASESQLSPASNSRPPQAKWEQSSGYLVKFQGSRYQVRFCAHILTMPQLLIDWNPKQKHKTPLPLQEQHQALIIS